MKHGKKNILVYWTWKGMRQRCFNKKHKYYKYYGERGITICEHWLKFKNFYEDMGDKPKGMTIERIDNTKGYSPKNCRWATRKEQARNRASNRIIKYNGKAQCMKAWAEELGIGYWTLRIRLNKYPPQIAFNL